MRMKRDSLSVALMTPQSLSCCPSASLLPAILQSALQVSTTAALDARHVQVQKPVKGVVVVPTAIRQ